MKSLVGALVAVIVLAMLFWLAGYLIVQTSDSVAGGVVAIEDTFRTADHEGSLLLIEDGGPPNEFAVGIGMVLRGVLFGGLPCGFLALFLGWRYRSTAVNWSSQWSTVFFAGFVFQLCNLCLVALLLVWLLPEVANPSRHGWAAGVTIGLVANALVSVLAIARWHSLRTRLRVEIPSILA